MVLQLKNAGILVSLVAEGGWVTLPNGDKMSPAISGWKSGSYSLETAPVKEHTTTNVPSPTVEDQRTNRASAYRDESDPLFFKWQRGEATEQEWLDKIEEIKERFPNPAE
jgi:hypothetical protein